MTCPSSVAWCDFGRLAEIHVDRQPAAFAVRGNVDGDRWYESFAGLGITAVDHRQSFDLGEVQLTCLGLGESFSRDPSPPVRRLRPDGFHVVIGHAPDFALGQIDADLLVAGHTHGGQVRLPRLGAITTGCKVPRAWAAGLTELSNGAKLLVSRGIGVERGAAPPIRFLCRPELAVIDLAPAPRTAAVGERSTREPGARPSLSSDAKIGTASLPETKETIP